MALRNEAVWGLIIIKEVYEWKINTDMWSEELCHKTSSDAWLKCAFPNLLLGETCRPEQSEVFRAALYALQSF